MGSDIGYLVGSDIWCFVGSPIVNTRTHAPCATCHYVCKEKMSKIKNSRLPTISWKNNDLSQKGTKAYQTPSSLICDPIILQGKGGGGGGVWSEWMDWITPLTAMTTRGQGFILF